MISIRTIGVFMIVCAAICLTIAIERYYSAIQTAEALAEILDGIEFESVSMPTVTKVCGFVGILLLVGGLRMLFDSLRGQKDQDHEDGLLKS